MGLKIAFFGSSLVSARWNGAATYYRGILRALHERGHRATFYEPDVYERQQHRDMDDPPWCRVVVYRGEAGAEQSMRAAATADLVVKASGVGFADAWLEKAVLEQRRAGQLVVFWDVDAPATLERLERDPDDPFRALVPKYDLVFTYGGGQPVVDAYRRLGAKACIPIYNGLDPLTHRPELPEARFAADLSLLANRLPDREARCDEFFFEAARLAPEQRFVLAGSGWEDKPRPENVRYLGHVYTHEHNAFNGSARVVLNVSRECMAKTGYSPATRVFEAAGVAACLITDAWQGIEQFFEPNREILVAHDAQDVCRHLRSLSASQREKIGYAARARALREHTYTERAREVERALGLAAMELAS